MSSAPDPATRAARAGLGRPSGDQGVDLVPALSLTSVRAYAGLSAVEEGMEGRDAYRRYGGGNPAVLEAALAELETPLGGEPPAARVTASGQAALLLAMTLMVSPARRRVVVVRPCYGATESLLTGPLGNLGVEATWVDLRPGDDTSHGDLVAAVLGDDVATVVTEVITNPLISLVDIPAIASVCRDASVPCIVDATFATPFLFRPFAHGADAVFHSLTKHLGGHSDVLGGVLMIRADHPAADWLDAHSRLVGANLSPFDSWLALRGLRTAALRVERASRNAAALAEFFAGRDELVAVHYPGTGGEQDARRAEQLLPAGRGPMLSIDLRGGRPAADALVRALDGIRLAPSLGDVATTVSHPALTSHRALSPEQRAALGIGPGLVRISTGIEHIDDLRAEFEAALVAAAAA